MDNLRGRVGFMHVIKTMPKDRAVEINNKLVQNIGDYLKDCSDYSQEIGEQVSKIAVDSLMDYPEMAAMFGSLKPPVRDNLVMELRDLTNNMLKEPGPMD
jgi:hypothetical protein